MKEKSHSAVPAVCCNNQVHIPPNVWGVVSGFLIILLMLPHNTQAQDTIVRLDGSKIACTIQKEDSVNVYFEIYRSGTNITTYLNKKDIKFIEYEPVDTASFTPDVISVGLGLGFDYGGIGVNLMAYPQKNIGLFVGIGYILRGVGYNAGIKLRAISDKKKMPLVPYALAMYGYNAVILIPGAKRFEKTFYGATVGLGFDFYPKKTSDALLSIAISKPFRDPEVERYIEKLKTYHGISFPRPLAPIGISVGFRF